MTTPASWRTAFRYVGTARGESYLIVLVSVTIVLLMAASLLTAFTHGTHLTEAMRARTELLNAGQSEMEQLRGMPLDQLETHPLVASGVTGEVTVESLSGRRKRVTISLRHTRVRNQTLTLVTYVHEQGLWF